MALLLGVVFVALVALQSSASADPRQTDLQSIGPSGGNGAIDAAWAGASADGSKVFFVTNESLVPADTDTADDVYMRQNGVTTLISIGPTGGNSSLDNAIFDDTSADGSIVYFSTTESLTSADTDSNRDVYQWNNGTVTLVSTGPVGGNGAVDAFYIDSTSDGSKMWFDTTEKLTSNDTDGGYQDVYQYAGGTTTLISTGPTGGSASFHAFYLDHSADGSHVYFQTGEAEVASDTDGGFQDVYDRSGGTTTLVSTGPASTNGAFDATYGGSTPDASHIFFMTKEVMTADDTDTSKDVYDRSGGTTTRVSTSSTAGNGAFNANMVGVSSDGSKVWFETREPMIPSDTDGSCLDAGGNPTLPCNDVYERSGGTTTLISCCGNGSSDAFFVGASDNGSVVFFHTNEAQTADDTDGGFQDVFQRSGGVTTLVSAGANGAHDSFWGGTSSDGSRVFFQTNDAMTANDTDGGYQDVYERYAGATTLVSTGPTATNAASQAFFDGNSKDGTVVFFDTDEKLVSADTDSNVDLYSSTQTFPGFARPKGAGPLTMKFVPAYQNCASPNRTHGPALSFPSCAPPTQESSVLTLGTPDNNGHPATSVSSVKLKVISTSPENVQVIMGINDVFCRAANAACPGGALSAYTGKLLLKLNLRVTDKYNGSPTSEGATVQDFSLGIPLQCSATADGGNCAATTTVNALIPGAVQDAKRAIWQVDQGQVWDAGPNGTGYGAGCPSTCGDGDESVFLRQGIFIP